MDKVTEVKKRYCTEQWRAMILECRQSDMTVKAFCKMKGFSEAAYYRHLKKFREELIGQLPEDTTDMILSTSMGSSPSPAIVPLKVIPDADPMMRQKAAMITIHLAKARIEIPDGIRTETMEAVISALNRTC